MYRIPTFLIATCLVAASAQAQETAQQVSATTTTGPSVEETPEGRALGPPDRQS